MARCGAAVTISGHIVFYYRVSRRIYADHGSSAVCLHAAGAGNTLDYPDDDEAQFQPPAAAGFSTLCLFWY